MGYCSADTSSCVILDTDFWQVYRYKAHVSIRHTLIKYPLTFVMTTAMLPVVHIMIAQRSVGSMFLSVSSDANQLGLHV